MSRSAARRWLGVVKHRLLGVSRELLGMTGAPFAAPGRQVWLFGAWEGKRFADNARYLYEHVRARCPDIEPVWIAVDPRALETARRAGGRAVRKGSWRALAYETRATVMFYTTSASDLTERRLPRARRVNLWHGMPLKKIGLDWEKPYDWGPHDATVATAECFVGPISSGLGIPEDRVWVTGLPRNDALFDPAARRRVASSLGLPPEARVIAYLPTWRPASHAYSQENTWRAMAAHPRLAETLSRHGAYLAVKPHPIDRPAASGTGPSGRFLSAPQNMDPQELLAASAALVTDYSSCYIDYLLLDRPIVFHCPDLEEYRRDPGFYLAYEEAAPGPKTSTLDELAGALESALSDSRKHDEVRRAARARFHRYLDDGACRRVVERVRSEAEGPRR